MLTLLLCLVLCPAARRVVPGASDDLIAVRKTKAPKAAAKHVTELPVIPNYEYELPVESSKGKQGQQLSADELKVKAVHCCQYAVGCNGLCAYQVAVLHSSSKSFLVDKAASVIVWCPVPQSCCHG